MGGVRKERFDCNTATFVTRTLRSAPLVSTVLLLQLEECLTSSYVSFARSILPPFVRSLQFPPEKFNSNDVIEHKFTQCSYEEPGNEVVFQASYYLSGQIKTNQQPIKILSPILTAGVLPRIKLALFTCM